jgi:hypothetical protein
MFDGEPLWFPSDELLTSVLHAEISTMMQLLAKSPDLRSQFDTPDATVPQRNVCFALLAHRKVISTILDTLAWRYIEPSLNDEESQALRLTYDLVADDAPAWALEMQRVMERLPAHIYASLPEPLRRGGYNPGNAEQKHAAESAKDTLNTVDQIRALTERVIDQQLTRLNSRWPTPEQQVYTVPVHGAPLQTSKKPKRQRTRDKERMRRDKQIFEIDDAAETPTEFLKIMDERKVRPQPTWKRWSGSWVKAYQDLHLRKLIQQDKSRAIARFRQSRKR